MCVDESVCVEHCTRGPKLAESIVEIWEAILHTLLVNVTCRGFQFCILALEPMSSFTPSSVGGIVVTVLVLFATTCKAVCAF